jgi:hypothetical protein
VEGVVIDEQDFMRAVYDLVGGSTKRRTSGEEIMRQLGLKPSALMELDKNLTTDDDLSYRALARTCDRAGRIKSGGGRGGSYSWVRITQSGIDYVEGRL